MNHPYRAYENTPLWERVQKAIDALVRNGDLIEQTPREYIVGYLCQAVTSEALERGPTR